MGRFGSQPAQTSRRLPGGFKHSSRRWVGALVHAEKARRPDSWLLWAYDSVKGGDDSAIRGAAGTGWIIGLERLRHAGAPAAPA